MLELLLIALAQAPYGPQGPIIARGWSQAFFEFASVTGTGMGTACACSNPTGAKGETMTFSRASSATCLKTTGLPPQSVANGDMVTCSSGQPRVMPGADGTSVLGMLVEPARTNIALRSQEFENAVWVASGSVAAAPTVTANAATAPDGTLTAERIQIPSVSSGFSLIQQLGLGAAGTYSEYVFAKGNGQSGSFIVDLGNASCLTCSYTNGVWGLCRQEGRVLGGAVPFSIGQDVADCGGGPFGAQDFFLWAAQMELGATATSYIATAGASATRAEDVGFFTVSFPATAGWSMAATWLAPTNSIANDPFAMEVCVNATASNNRYDLYIPAPTQFSSLVRVGGSTFSSTTSVASQIGQTLRLSGFYDGVNQTACSGSTCLSTPQSYTPFAADRVVVGNFVTGADPAQGVVKRLCYDPSPARCR